MILIIALMVLVLALFKPTIITEALTAMGMKSPPPTGRSEPVPIGLGYINTCLTKKPYGFPSHSHLYRYWKDRPKSWAVEFSEERVRGDINKVRSNQDPSSVLAGLAPTAKAAGKAAGKGASGSLLQRK
jgi:hypothetical protein